MRMNVLSEERDGEINKGRGVRECVDFEGTRKSTGDSNGEKLRKKF